MTDTDFQTFPSITRLSRDMVITEKLDGCNAQILVAEDGGVRVGSRNRWLTVDNDHFGFAAWAQEHRDALVQGLGPGRHYGEWWGHKIQHGYGLKERRFSLFNVLRWCPGEDTAPLVASPNPLEPAKPRTRVPACCHVVPVLYVGPFDTAKVDILLIDLKLYGSRAVPGWTQPEGVVVCHVPSRTLFKKTLGGDGHKGAQ